MYLNINAIVYTIACAAAITGIVIGIVRKRCATIKDEIFVVMVAWFGLALFSTFAEFVFKRFGWYMAPVTFVVGVLSLVFIGYCVVRIGCLLFHAYRKNRNL